jgi:hypothetical protein
MFVVLWQTHKPHQGVHGAYTENDTGVIPFKSRRKDGGGGGSRTALTIVAGVQFIVIDRADVLDKKRLKGQRACC